VRTLAETSLSDHERALLDRFVDVLGDELGDELQAVWLYGSRARGEPPAHGDSDVDVIVLVGDTSLAPGKRVHAALEEAARQLGDQRTGIWLSVHVYDLEWLAGRRGVDSFYIAEVDRDKIVLVGGEFPTLTGSPRCGKRMSPRSEEFMDTARIRLAGAEAALDVDPATALSAAYYAMLYAARAALSERDLYAKTHDGTWGLFYRTFSEPGDFDAGLTAAARAAQPMREKADYEAWAAPRAEAVKTIEVAHRFLAAVDALCP
jgi:uncharacterized protein (UPF0332 family)/predicted nucleotidyltransferase